MSYKSSYLSADALRRFAAFSTHDEAENDRRENLITKLATEYGAKEYGAIWENRLRERGEHEFANDLSQLGI